MGDGEEASDRIRESNLKNIRTKMLANICVGKGGYGKKRKGKRRPSGDLTGCGRRMLRLQK